MCGIAGIFRTNGAPVDPAQILAMAGDLAHRGPDDAGLWVDQFVGLGHRRLSIIDLAGGHQPMSTADGMVWVVFNGEIYNFRELRACLEGKGVSFRTNSDTEVILHLYVAYGEKLLSFLNGMFAFAIYDKRERQLLLARDRLGKKPLFYFHREHCFAFASELHALRRIPEFPADLREQSVNEFLSYQYIPCPNTIYQNVRKLPPAHFLVLPFGAAREPEPHRYWHVSYETPARIHFADAAVRLRELLADAVRLRMVADVPLGALLSGGVDSTCVTGLMREVGKNPLRSFTLGFPAAAYDERPFARLAARAIGSDHAEQEVNPADFAAVRLLVRHCGEPYADASILPTYLLCRFARQHVTVALGGDGADEVFGGYERYLAMRLARHFDLVPQLMRRGATAPLLRMLRRGTHERTFSARLRRWLELAPARADERYFRLVTHVPEPLKIALYGRRMRAASLTPASAFLGECFAAATSPASRAAPAEVDLHSYLPNDILMKVDVASMAASLEVRTPFLDHRVVEFAAALPWRFKQSRLQRKRILLAACGDLIPEEIRQRPKKGFGVPLAQWLREDWAELARQILLDPVARRRGFFLPERVEWLLAEHQESRADHSYILWSLLIFELWCQEFLPS